MAPEIYFPNLNIKINHLSSVAFKFGNLSVYWYGIIIVSAIFIGYFMIDRTLKKEGSSIDKYINFIMIVLITSLLSARLYYVIFSWDYYRNNLGQILNFRAGGIAIYGAVIGAIVTALIYTKIKNESFLRLADLFIPYLILGQAMGRWGNFFNRECFGGLSNSLFALAIRCDTLKYMPKALENSTCMYFGSEYLQVAPTFLYESIPCFLLFLFLKYRYSHKKFDGELLFMYLMGYSFIRFFVEGLRTDQLQICGIAVSQIVAIVLFIIGLALYVVNYKNKKEGKI